jgi:hypothetical protein
MIASICSCHLLMRAHRLLATVEHRHGDHPVAVPVAAEGEKARELGAWLTIGIS